MDSRPSPPLLHPHRNEHAVSETAMNKNDKKGLTWRHFRSET